MIELRTRRRRLSALLALGDAALVFASLALGYAGLGALGATSAGAFEVAKKLAGTAWILVPSHLVVLYLAGLQVPQRSGIGGRYAIRLALAVAGGAVLASGGLYYLPEVVVGRQPLLLHLPLLFALLLGWRSAVFRRAAREPSRRLAIVGRRAAVEELVAELERETVGDYRIGRVKLLPEAGSGPIPRSEALAGLETGEELEKLLELAEFDALALDTAGLELSAGELSRVIELDHSGVEIHDLAALHKRIAGSFPRSAVKSDAVLRAVAARPRRRSQARLKRLLDVTAAGAGLAFLGIPMLLLAVLVKLDSRGPAFFLQERLGHRRRPFRCIKFRTMIEGAERESGPRWAGAGDPRITRLGAFLRATRLDELPQLLCVLRGDMSLVGPRPIRDHFARRLAERIPFYDLRFGVPPGLTGWAQVNQHYVASDEDQETKFLYELFHLENSSLLLDLHILLKTARAVVMRRGT